MRLSRLLLAIPLVGCAGNSQPQTPEAGGVVTGTVAYRERMALPPDAVVQVQLLDVSRQDLAASPVAGTTVSPGGRQVPLPFELHYDPSRIEPSHTYAVRATIQSEGRLIFTTPTSSQVITHGNPYKVDLLLSRVAEVADAPGDLSGSAWVLEDLGGSGVIDGARATLEFPERGKTAGAGSCNRFLGTVQITGSAIAFGPLGTTLMACAEAVMNQEGRYLGALQGAQRYTVDGAILRVYAKGIDQPLRFTRDRP